MNRLIVNGTPVDVPPGSTVLDACRAAGAELPTLCHDDRLHSVGVCRLCLVQQGGREQWDDYKAAINDMMAHTSTEFAPWTLVAGNDKKFARVQILKTL